MLAKPKLSFTEIKDVIRVLSGDVDKFSDSELYQYFKRLTIGLPMQTLNFQRGLLFRGRSNIGSTLFENISELWYPPIGEIRPNRFNDKNTQVLYVADAKSTVIQEIKSPPGSIVTLITFSATEQITTLPIGISYGVTKQQIFNTDLLRKDNFKKAEYFHNDQNLIKIDQIVMKFLFDIVTKENITGNFKEYRLTNIIAKHLFQAKIDGLLYPSISRKLYDINMALKKESKSKLKVTQVDVIKMDSAIEGRFELIACSNQFGSNGEIIYNNQCGSFTEMIKI